MSFYADRWWRDNATALARLEERVNGESEARSNLRAEVGRLSDNDVALFSELQELFARTDRIAQSMSALAASHVELMRTVAALQRPSLDQRILARARTYVGKI